ncbi:hypothetical protein [Ilumatobacter sp.]|uniref:hypothetical protein n=1 Tax=Ilumatobacter sp. TaxID=1967498 RepID=UPI003B52229E
MTTSEPPSDGPLARLAAIEARLARHSEFRHGTPGADAPRERDRHAPTRRPAAADHRASGDGRTAARPSGSRRDLLRLAAGTAAVGAGAALASRSGTVAAADGSNLVLGSDVNVAGDSGTTSTRIAYVNDEAPRLPGIAGPYAANIFLVDDVDDAVPFPFDPGPTDHPAASAGYGGDSVPNGMYGRTTGDGHGVVAHGADAGATGLLAIGERANLELANAGDAPAARSGAHRRGEVVADRDGTLWYCVSAGSPGTWRTLAGAATAGALHPLTPFRAFDSRFDAGGRLSAGDSVTVSVAVVLDPTTGAVVRRDAVPAGAVAVAANVAAVRTGGTGFLTVNPGGDDAVGASALNWTDGANLSNAGIYRLGGDRRLEVIAGGEAAAAADVVVDITGYYL